MSFHGDKRQAQRTRILDSFKKYKLNFLIATDVAARGIDIDDIMFVVNYDLPTQPEIYVHRIGRTARAGKEGIAISFCDETEKKRLIEIERLIGYRFNVEDLNIKSMKNIKNAENNSNRKFSKNKIKRKLKNKAIKLLSPKQKKFINKKLKKELMK